MRSARRNIGKPSTNPSSLPAAGRADDRWRMETGGRYRQSPLLVRFRPYRTPVGVISGLILFRLVAFGGRSAMGWSVPLSLGEFLVEGRLQAGNCVWLLFFRFSLTASAAAGETSRAMRLALLISATRRS